MHSTYSASTLQDSVKSLLANYHLFAQLSKGAIQELASFVEEVHYKSGDNIVKENDFVDSFFLIATGKAQVTQKKITHNTEENIIIAILHEGDAIGLNEEGFFSSHGKRTASVIALTDTTLLRISIENFNKFLQSHPDFNKKFEKMTELLLKLDFIKQTYPFVHLKNEEIYAITQHVKEIAIPANTIVFNQGDISDCCYLIRTGEVEIFVTDQESNEQRLSILEKSQLLGEASLLTSQRRNASARTLSDARFIVIHNHLLNDMIKSSQDFAQSIMGFVVRRFRPTVNKDVVAHKHITDDGRIMVMLQNTSTNQYQRLTEEGWFIWQQLDGVQTIQDLTVTFFKKYKAFIPEVICNLLYNLAEPGFVHIPAITSPAEDPAQKSWLAKLKDKIKKFVDIELTYNHADKSLTYLYQHGISLFYTIPSQIAFATFGFIAFGMFINLSYQIATTNESAPNFWLFLLLLIPISLMTVILHEGGHAFTAKYFGYKIQRIGVGWYWLSPIAFVDTSELWIAKKKIKLAVNAAGVYVDFIIGGLLACAAFIAQHTSKPELAILLWLFSLFIYLNGFRNLSPIREYDGYFILADMLERTKLRKSAIHWLAFLSPRQLFNKEKGKHYAEVIYWGACLTYLIINSLLIFFVAKMLLKIYKIDSLLGLSSYQFSLSIATLAFGLSMLTIAFEVKQYRKMMDENEA